MRGRIGHGIHYRAFCLPPLKAAFFKRHLPARKRCLRPRSSRKRRVRLDHPRPRPAAAAAAALDHQDAAAPQHVVAVPKVGKRLLRGRPPRKIRKRGGPDRSEQPSADEVQRPAGHPASETAPGQVGRPVVCGAVDVQAQSEHQVANLVGIDPAWPGHAARLAAIKTMSLGHRGPVSGGRSSR